MRGPSLRAAQIGMILLALSARIGSGIAEPSPFVAPPRTVADIEAILDGQKPEDARIKQLNATATAAPAPNADPGALTRLHLLRAFALSELGRYPQAIDELKRGIRLGDEHHISTVRLRLDLGYIQSFAGDNVAALETFENTLAILGTSGGTGNLLTCLRWLVQVHIYLSNLPKAAEYDRKLDEVLRTFRDSPQYNETAYDSARIQVEFGHARLFDARGQYRDAEQHYELALSLIPALRKFAASRPAVGSLNYIDTMADNLTASAGRAKARQGRFAEGEAQVRRALLGRLNAVGKYNLTTARTLPYLSTILVEEGRVGEAERLTRATIDIYRTLGVENDSLAYAFNLGELGTILCLEEKWQEASGVFEELDRTTSRWESTRRADLLLTPARIHMLYSTGRQALGLAQAEAMLRRVTERVGDSHFDTAVARGMVAIGLVAEGRHAQAAGEFRAAVPFLAGVAVHNADEASGAAMREYYARRIVEAYIALVARTAARDDQSAHAETFRLAEAIRAHSVQKALVASTLRTTAKDVELAGLIRTEQDLEKQLGAELGLLNNALSLPSSERDGAVVKQIAEKIETLRGEQAKAGVLLKQRFPEYSELVDPVPPGVDKVRAALRTDESFLSIYVGHDQTFIWAIPKEGPTAFEMVALPASAISERVRRLREALEPQAAMISDIPAFDTRLAYELFSRLLQPVETGWRRAKSLVVVTNGPLGLLPLSLLPTAAVDVDVNAEPLFSGYRKVPWLALTHAVTTVPSAAALLALRNLPPGKAGRGKLIAFGDPIFSREQLKEAAAGTTGPEVSPAATATRSRPLRLRNSPKLETVDSADLAMLPRLPDTADELRSIASALMVDASEVVYLGSRADEHVVETLNLSNTAIIAFATHGLVPGELNGLTQPALALSSPDVTGNGGDGLLTLDEILGLKLDADWIVLSACNTGAGAGAGAEAASGLGQAFFYAGTRALLVTNWSVHSQSARQLVTDLFKRQAENPAISRAEALREAMMALADGPGYVDADGKTLFAYAHPLFWAPYSIIGDGGAR